jgi:hemolysin III
MQKLSKDHSPHITSEAVNTATHMGAAIFGLFGAGLLITQSALGGKWWHLGSFIAYGIGLVGLFVMSALHHGVNGSEITNKRLRTLDYIAVYGLIVGTIVPVCLVMFRGVVGFAVLATVIVAASFGIVMRSLYDNLPQYVSLTLYVCLGWLPIVLPVLSEVSIPEGGLALLVGGGLSYTIGALIYAKEKPNPIPGKFGFHEIWHIAVILGALCHFIFLYRYVLPLN